MLRTPKRIVTSAFRAPDARVIVPRLRNPVHVGSTPTWESAARTSVQPGLISPAPRVRLPPPPLSGGVNAHTAQAEVGRCVPPGNGRLR